MKRPILIAVIGYIIGIIVGLYFSKSIVLIYIPIIAIYFINKLNKNSKTKKLKLLSTKRYLRYIKIYLTSKVVITIIISSIISNTIVIFQNKNYENIYNELSTQEKLKSKGIIISEKQEKQYYNKYKIQVEYNRKKLKFYITTTKDIELQYGDEVLFYGTYTEPETQRNYKGFNYSQYLKQLKIYGTIESEKIEILNKNQANKLFEISNQVLNKIILNSQKILKDEISSVLLGLMLGYKANIDEDVQENFRNASMTHILAVSGMHVTYVIIGINFILKNLIKKKRRNILIIIILIFYMFITNFSPSITRAGIMGITMIFSKLSYRKNDIYTSIALSLILILIYNPFLIQNLGLQLSYGGVIGIVIYNKKILNMLKNIKIKNKTYRYKIKPKIQKNLNKIKEIISVSVSAQIIILPILICNLNTFNLYFLISNLILSLVIGPIVIFGFLFIIIVLINTQIAQIFSAIIEVGIQTLILISKIGELPASKIYIATPSLFSILTYYSFIIILFFVYDVYSSKKPNITQIRAKNLIALIKIKTRKNKNKLKYIITITFLFILIINLIPKNLKIYFVDVGQGDSTLIITPKGKSILIDGGGSTNPDFDVGEKTLIPYLLDRGLTKIDIVIISHFDQDHIRRNSYFIKRIKSRKSIYV